MGRKVVFCNCGGDRLSQERLHAIEISLSESGIEFIKLSDLCGLSATGNAKLSQIFINENEYLIIGCHSRAMKLLLERANIDIINNSIDYINFLELSNEDISRHVSKFYENNDQKTPVEEIISDPDWPSWFPVIDYARCTSCGQCSDFCLFGVYEKENGKVKVSHPKECKNNCPACARICPQTAIIFPKYKQGGAIGGSDFIDEIAEQKRQADDINTFLQGDIYNALEHRKQKRRSIILEEAMKKALDERNDALNKSKNI
jgi:NAD-dependent dihydropyrimidine dehydrogenase PreA subunit